MGGTPVVDDGVCKYSLKSMHLCIEEERIYSRMSRGDGLEYPYKKPELVKVNKNKRK
jgi:hypothetical protein